MNVLLISDVHANLVALEAVYRACPSPDAIWNLGDSVGYGPRPGACLDLLIERGADPALVGNHDLACIGRLDLAAFNRVAQAACRWTSRQLTPTHVAYLGALPAATTVVGYELAHASPRSPIWEYVDSAGVATEILRGLDADVCFVGHTHVASFALLRDRETRAQMHPLEDGQILDLHAGRYLVNPGSVGQPRDRDPRAAYALLDPDRGILTAHRVEYDIAETQRQMADANLPEQLISRLRSGR